VTPPSDDAIVRRHWGVESAREIGSVDGFASALLFVAGPRIQVNKRIEGRHESGSAS
jgi:hypothetical protein